MRRWQIPVEMPTEGWEPETIEFAKLTATVLSNEPGQRWLAILLVMVDALEVTVDPPKFQRGRRSLALEIAHAYNLGKTLEIKNE